MPLKGKTKTKYNSGKLTGVESRNLRACHVSGRSWYRKITPKCHKVSRPKAKGYCGNQGKDEVTDKTENDAGLGLLHSNIVME